MEAFKAVYIFFIGACLGSFMNVLTYRLPRGLNIAIPPSSCTKCGQRIKFYDNIPVLSWFILGGRCRNCKSPISIMYPLAELGTGLMFLGCYLKFGLTLEMWHGCAVVFFMLAAAFSDVFTAVDDNFECGIIPDSLNLAGFIVGFALSWALYGTFKFPLYGALTGFLGLFIPSYLFKLIRKKEGMGGGDIKLMAVVGAMLGIKSIFFVIFASAFLGAVYGISLQLVSRQKNIILPFGPFIAAASVIYLFYAPVFDALLYNR
ncbi:A24 family peptidase [Seleniivibrio sp.]|uniref:prepilin peptidase n=1 Tax=Seleniivibrio sp. TaxID=2898801 RepID=UPI0025DED906|nr:A24 family peptidase [Seleniivibrio sp.]MCD8555029.1 prepilin peptidase [Seleniivibrio sp.]